MIPSIISEASVRLALDSIIMQTDYARSKSLQHLLIVDEFMESEPNLPNSPLSRAFALKTILINMITEELMQARQLFEVKTLDNVSTFRQIKQQIRADAHAGKYSLISWSWLYYHYVSEVRPFTQQEFCDIVHLDDRTIRRYQNYAIAQLTNQIITAEWAAALRKSNFGRLPPPPIVDHVGRHLQLFQAYYHFLLGNITPLQIVGSVEIGKSAFVRHFIQMLILRGQISDVYWLDMSKSTSHVQLSWEKAVRGIFTRWRSPNKFFKEQRMVLVLDGINPDIHQSLIRDFNYTRQALSNAFICMTTQTPIQFKQPVTYMHLTELPAGDAFNLIDALLTFYNIRFKRKFISEIIWDEAKGNPAAIHEAVARYVSEQREQKAWMGQDKVQAIS